MSHYGRKTLHRIALVLLLMSLLFGAGGDSSARESPVYDDPVVRPLIAAADHALPERQSDPLRDDTVPIAMPSNLILGLLGLLCVVLLRRRLAR